MQGNVNQILLAGSPADCSDLRYATGLSSSDTVFFFRKGTRRYLLVSPLDAGHVRRIVHNAKVYSFDDFPVRSASRNRGPERFFAFLKKAGAAKKIFVPHYFPLGLARKLEKLGLRLIVAKDPIFPERTIKRPEEIRSITHVQKAACQAMNAACRLIACSKISSRGILKLGRRPLTAAMVREQINSALQSFGCIGHKTIVACGAQAANPHESGWGTLRAYRPIVIDIFPRHIATGYWGDLTRTISRGQPPDKILAMFTAVRRAQLAAMARIKNGVKASEIHNAAVEVFRQHGFAEGETKGRGMGFIHSIGHGLGLDVHEYPAVGPDARHKLTTNNVITVEPGLYYPGQAGIRIEDTVLVTRYGFRLLAGFPYRFVL